MRKQVMTNLNMMIEAIKNKYITHNKQDVLQHVEDVARVAVSLAEIHGLDVEKIRLAALLHDVSCIMTPQEMYVFAKERNLTIDPAEEKYHALLHQRISKIMAHEEFGITDPIILQAIECHTTLIKNASIYDKVIFIADKISWDQKLSDLKATATQSLDEACYAYIQYQFDNDLLVMLHQWLLAAFEELKKDHTI